MESTPNPITWTRKRRRAFERPRMTAQKGLAFLLGVALLATALVFAPSSVSDAFAASPDEDRVVGVDQAIAALESYAAENFTYAVFGAGSQGEGVGKFEGGSSYPAIISDVLEAQGHIDAPVIGDPNGTLRVYTCADRVAVFADTDSISASATDLAWWSANNCTRSPIDNYGYQYMQLSETLPTAVCEGEVVTVNMAQGEEPTIGADVIFGTPGDDNLTVWHNETVCTGRGNDIVVLDAQNTTVNLGPGNDQATGESRGNVTIHAGSGQDTVEMDENSNWVEVRGGAGNDHIIGGAGSDKLYGDGGEDFIDGRDQNDIIDGGAGNDDLRGGDGNDTAEGGDGDDRIYGGTGNDTLRGGDGDDRFWGSDGADTIFGDGGNDRLRGGDGADSLNGGTGDDNLKGEAGTDTLKGNAGHDDVYGGTGVDTLNGGAGIDLCSSPGTKCETKFDDEAPGDFDFVVTPGGDHVALNWTGATDNIGVVSYELHVDGTRLWFTLDPTVRYYVQRGLSENTEYDFAMVAVDEQGNQRILDSITSTTRDLIVEPHAPDTSPDPEALPSPTGPVVPQPAPPSDPAPTYVPIPPDVIAPQPPTTAISGDPEAPVALWDCANAGFFNWPVSNAVGIIWTNAPGDTVEFHSALFENAEIPTQTGSAYRVSGTNRVAYFTGLTPNALYGFSVEAFDASGASLGACRGTVQTTEPAPDPEPADDPDPADDDSGTSTGSGGGGSPTIPASNGSQCPDLYRRVGSNSVFLHCTGSNLGGRVMRVSFHSHDVYHCFVTDGPQYVGEMADIRSSTAEDLVVPVTAAHCESAYPSTNYYGG